MKIFLKIVGTFLCVVIILANLLLLFGTTAGINGANIVLSLICLGLIYFMWFRKKGITTHKLFHNSPRINMSISTGVDINSPPIPNHLAVGFPKEVLALIMFTDHSTYYNKTSNSFNVLKKYDSEFVTPIIQRTEHGLDVWHFEHLSDKLLQQLFESVKTKNYIEIDNSKSALNNMSIQELKSIAKEFNITLNVNKKDDIIKQIQAELSDNEIENLSQTQFFKPTSIGEKTLNDYKLQILIYRRGWGFTADNIRQAVKFSANIDEQINHLFSHRLQSYITSESFHNYSRSCLIYGKYLEENNNIAEACYYYFLNIYISLSGLSNQGRIDFKKHILINDATISLIRGCFAAQLIDVKEGVKVFQEYQDKVPILKFQYYTFQNTSKVIHKLLLLEKGFSDEDAQQVLDTIKSKAEPKHLQEVSKKLKT